MTPLYAGVGGVVRELTEMDAGINGVVTPLTEMWAGVNGVNRQIFSSGTPVGDLAVGDIIQLRENLVPVDYIVVHQGLPGSMYDASFPGGRAFDAQISKPIEFTVEGKTYQAPAELKWQFFVKTPYNVDGFEASSNGVYNAEGTMRLYYGGNYVYWSDDIIENGAYTWGSAPP